DLIIDASTILAGTSITLGGGGGLRSVTGSMLTAGEDIVVAQGAGGVPTTFLSFAILDAGRRISIGGSSNHIIHDSAFFAGGDGPVDLDPNTLTVAPSPPFVDGVGIADSEILRSTFSAANG